ncbi:hypothetical protein GW17_00043710 [Ensete ventricosum]|uniref:Uncharacterized protein n=1 Tax=Ensete ventricosum TaxID=4639 RepID=A0A444D6L2_ENSVE|nr:hypothetical protein GW17_00043710 [Ensete ventricosum]RZR72293.1 hypothetical protein BHM03_00012001 [Ensete ventricosum]
MKTPWNNTIPLFPLQEFMSLTSKECFMPSLHVSSSTLTPFMRLRHFTKFHPSCSASRFALS